MMCHMQVSREAPLPQQHHQNLPSTTAAAMAGAVASALANGNGMKLTALLTQSMAAKAAATSAEKGFGSTPPSHAGAGASLPSLALGDKAGGVKRPGPGIDALIAAGVAIDLSKRARKGDATPSPQQPASARPGQAATRPAGDGGHRLHQRSPLALPALPSPGALPEIPDLESFSSGPGGVVKVFLQVTASFAITCHLEWFCINKPNKCCSFCCCVQALNLLRLPFQAKACLLAYVKAQLALPGTQGRDSLDVLYAFLQVQRHAILDTGMSCAFG